MKTLLTNTTAKPFSGFMKGAVGLLTGLVFLSLSGCALRIGLNPSPRISTGSYPPVKGVYRLFCAPCLEFDGWSVGLMFLGGWPVVFYVE